MYRGSAGRGGGLEAGCHYSDELNVELSRISSALSIMATILDEMPDGQQNFQLKKLIVEANNGCGRVDDLRLSIAKAASQI
jgi:hypothetical protein